MGANFRTERQRKGSREAANRLKFFTFRKYYLVHIFTSKVRLCFNKFSQYLTLVKNMRFRINRTPLWLYWACISCLKGAILSRYLDTIDKKEACDQLEINEHLTLFHFSSNVSVRHQLQNCHNVSLYSTEILNQALRRIKFNS